VIRLATRGDDAGTAASANLAIRACAESGLLRNASVVVPAPAIEHAAAVLADAPLCIGLHVTLTAEWERPRWGPVADADAVASLLREDGTFPATVEELADLDPDPAEVRTEAAAQLDRLRRLGFDVAYLDTHMLVDRVAGVGDPLASLRADEGLADGNAPDPLPDPEGGAGAGAGVGNGPAALLRRLAAADDGTYLLVGHPAYDDAEMRGFERAGDPPGLVAADRDAQRRLFAAPSVRAYCAERGVEAVRFDA
jgi:hypothetical protein